MFNPPIPLRITASGDTAKAKELIGFAKKRMFLLDESMEFQNLDTNRSFLKMQDGSTITCISNHGLSQVHIYVPEGDEEEIPVVGECRCGEYFSEGVIVGVHPVDGYITPTQLYTVDVCQKGNTQITVENCAANDYSVFAVEQKVWVCLILREMVATIPHGDYGSDIFDDFAFAASWGGCGSRQGYSVAAWQSGDTSPYETISPNADGPCGMELDVPDDEWPGPQLTMCELSQDIMTCYWLSDDPNGYSPSPVKNYETMYTDYSMKKIAGESPDVPEEPMKWIFNLQVIAQ